MPLRWYAPVAGVDVSGLEDSPFFRVVNGTIHNVIMSYGVSKKTVHVKLKDENQMIYEVELSSQNDFEDLYQITGVRDLRPLVGMKVRIYLRSEMDEEDCDPKKWFYTFAIDLE